MSLIHRLGAGLLLLTGAMPCAAQDWVGGGCAGCGIDVPAIDNGLGRDHRWGPRMRYRSTTRIAGHMGQPMIGPMPAVGLGQPGCCGPTGMLPMVSPLMGCCPPIDCAPQCAPAPAMNFAPAPMIVPQVETQMVPQAVTTYCEVPKTVMRREAVQVQVPTTTYRQVTVDEGSYQWVSKLVTKSVPQTVMQTQTQYRDVPTTVTERVPRTTTQWVPKQVVRQVPQMTTGQCYGPTASNLYPTVTPTEITPVPEAYNPTPLNPVPEPVGSSATAPATPPQTSQIQEWQKVRQRQIEQQNYEYLSEDTGLRVPKAAGRFSGVKR